MNPRESEMAASIRENLRQQRKAAKAVAEGGGRYIDALTQLQVDERADWTPERITERYAARTPKATAARRRTPGIVRHRTMPQSQEINGVTEPWTLGPGRRGLLPGRRQAPGQPHARRPDEHRGPVLRPSAVRGRSPAPFRARA